jgi:hypothetical protein
MAEETRIQFFCSKSVGKSLLGDLNIEGSNKIKLILQEIECKSVICIHLFQRKVQCCGRVNTEMKLRIA